MSLSTLLLGLISSDSVVTFATFVIEPVLLTLVVIVKITLAPASKLPIVQLPFTILYASEVALTNIRPFGKKSLRTTLVA